VVVGGRSWRANRQIVPPEAELVVGTRWPVRGSCSGVSRAARFGGTPRTPRTARRILRARGRGDQLPDAGVGEDDGGTGDEVLRRQFLS